MKYTIQEGNYEKMGVWYSNKKAIFTFHAEKEDDCAVVLTHKVTKERTEIEVPHEYCFGSLRSVAISGLQMKDYYYAYLKNGEELLDDYAPAIAGREVWNDSSRAADGYKVYGTVVEEGFSWRGDRHPEIPSRKMLMYKLHIRGFSMDRRMRAKGTFGAVERQIPYLKRLGITTVEMMPVYEFEEMPIPEEKPKLPDYITWEEDAQDLIPKAIMNTKPEKKLNYWGYSEGNYFAVKASYAQVPENAAQEFKHLVRTLHENGMECVVEMYFDGTDHNLILDALHYWVKEFHVDGFHLIGPDIPSEDIIKDVTLSRTKFFYMDPPPVASPQKKYERLFIYKEEYQYPARKVLNHINANLAQFVEQQRKQGKGFGYINFVASNNGFTLADCFMYNDKHNEANGEENLDGDNWNFSSNCGTEGPSRRKKLLGIRRKQWRNAMAMIMLAQGVPLIWSGDEFGNSQEGNNNAYCQDNPVGWVNWKSPAAMRPYEDFLTKMIAFRKEHPILAPEEPFTFADHKGSGFPDLSYHGSHAWISDADYGSMSVGMLYNGAYAPDSVKAGGASGTLNGVAAGGIVETQSAGSEAAEKAETENAEDSAAGVEVVADKIEKEAASLTESAEAVAKSEAEASVENTVESAEAAEASDERPGKIAEAVKATAGDAEQSAVDTQDDEMHEDLYVAYNFYSEETKLALPQLGRKRTWYLVMNTDLEEPWLAEPEPLGKHQYLTAPAQSICILIGK